MHFYPNVLVLYSNLALSYAMPFSNIILVMLQVDCTGAGKDTCSDYSVSGYPTVKIFRRGEFSEDYNGGRDAGKFTYNHSFNSAERQHYWYM